MNMSKKIKIGFHLNNANVKGVDLRFPEKGNPGIGGTPFTTIALAYYLKKFFPDKVEPVIFSDHTELFPDILNVHPAQGVVEAIHQAHKYGCDIFVFRSTEKDENIFNEIERLKLKSIARSNNTPELKRLNALANCPYVVAHVCVGLEQLDLLRNHRLIDKSTTIFDVFNSENFTPSKVIKKGAGSVVFIGNIIPSKGFHHLARAWPEILKRHPDAHLTVIGSGKLYNRNMDLGKWGVATESYENELYPYLSDQEGNIKSSVCFAGLLGFEKIDILQRSVVGVVNPTGFTEVCPASALEIQACGTPVVSGADWGLLDTVIHNKTGLLGKGRKKLVDNIV